MYRCARPLPAAVRFVLQAGVVVIALYLAVDVVPMPAYLPYGLVLAVAGLGWIWFINLYNFMDGIDGISSIETISVGAGTGIVWWLAADAHHLRPFAVDARDLVGHVQRRDASQLVSSHPVCGCRCRCDGRVSGLEPASGPDIPG